MRAAFRVDSPNATALRALNYSPFTELFRRKRRGYESLHLREVLSEFGGAAGSVFTRIDCEPLHGVHLLSQVDVFSSEPEGRTIRRDSMPHPERHEIKKWQVLLSGAGQMGESTLFARSIIADGRLAGKYVGPDSVVMTFKEPNSDLSLYVYAFLLTDAGVSIVRSCAYGTSIPRVRLDLLKNIPIPIPPREQIVRVASLIRKTVELREKHLGDLQAARGEIEGMPEVQEAAIHCAERKARCVLWKSELQTLAAWNLASTGGALELLHRKWKARLGDVLVGQGVYNGPRFARVLCRPPHGIDFYSQRDLFLIKRVPRRIAHPGFKDSMLFVPEGGLLVGGHGTLGEGEIFGRVVYVSGRLAKAGFTQDLLRVLPKADAAALTYAFLSTDVGFRLLRTTGVGTKLLMMRTDLLRNLPFPEIDSVRQTEIQKRIDLAMKARNNADAAEDEAVRIIEQEVLPSWLD